MQQNNNISILQQDNVIIKILCCQSHISIQFIYYHCCCYFKDFVKKDSIVAVSGVGKISCFTIVPTTLKKTAIASKYINESYAI